MSTQGQQHYYRSLAARLGLPRDFVETYIELANEACLAFMIAQLQLVEQFRLDSAETLERLRIGYRLRMAETNAPEAAAPGRHKQ